jgi:hypothetical protein
LKTKRLLILGGSTLFFAGAGFAYYSFVGCQNGTCAIASSPTFSTILGAVIGASVGWTASDRRSKDANL